MTQRMSRREILKMMGLGAAALTLPGGMSRVLAQGSPTVTMLAEDHFAPEHNAALTELVAAWAKEKGVGARVDFVTSRDAPARLAAEAESRRGHDLVYLWRMDAALYKDSLAPVDDVAEEIGQAYGGWLETGPYLNKIDGTWRAVPFYQLTYPPNVNLKQWESLGIGSDELSSLTWDDLLRHAKSHMGAGHPIAFAISQDYDSSEVLYPLLWSFGGRTVDEKGNVIIDSQETRDAFNYLKKLYEYMPKDVIGWSGANNNTLLLTGLTSWTPNPPTIYAVARLQGLPVADEIYHFPMPGGPAGRYRGTFAVSLGIWEFAENGDLAKDLLRYLYRPENYQRLVEASIGSNEPFVRNYPRDYWKQDPHLAPIQPPVEDVLPDGWPGPPGAETATAIGRFILPVAMAKAVTGQQSIDASIREISEALKRIYG